VQQRTELLAEFPADERPIQDIDNEPAEGDERPHGKCKVIAWLPFDGYDRARAAAEFARRGVKYVELFPTARFWCASVYE
jgi:hypothetical protein